MSEGNNGAQFGEAAPADLGGAGELTHLDTGIVSAFSPLAELADLDPEQRAAMLSLIGSKEDALPDVAWDTETYGEWPPVVGKPESVQGPDGRWNWWEVSKPEDVEPDQTADNLARPAEGAVDLAGALGLHHLFDGPPDDPDFAA